MENYYELLSVSPSASNEELEQAIFKQQRLWHSRVNSADFERRVKAERMLRKLEEIQDILLDDEKREAYNKSLFTFSISGFRTEAEEQKETTQQVPGEKADPPKEKEEKSENGTEQKVEKEAKEETKKLEDQEKSKEVTETTQEKESAEVPKIEEPIDEPELTDDSELTEVKGQTPDDMYRLGKQMLDRDSSETDLIKGIEWMIRAAEAGSIHAMYQLALYFFEGEVLPSDPVEGEKWLRQAADAGYIPAMVELGRRLLDGDQLERNSSQGIEWIGKAAELGDEKATTILNEWMYQLGVHFLDATSKKDKGEEWLRKAADAGHVAAMLDLGRRLLDGDQLKKSSTEGVAWLVKAAQKGSSEAQQLLDSRRSHEQGKQPTNPTTSNIFQPAYTAHQAPKTEKNAYNQSATYPPTPPVQKKNYSGWFKTALVIVAIFIAVYWFNDLNQAEPADQPPDNNKQEQPVEQTPTEKVNEPKKEEQPEQKPQQNQTQYPSNTNNNNQQNNGTTDPNNGGTPDPNHGGTTDPNNGGTPDPGNGGTPDPGNGGTPDPDNGGTPDPGNGGTTDPDNGGTPDPGNGGGGQQTPQTQQQSYQNLQP